MFVGENAKFHNASLRFIVKRFVLTTNLKRIKQRNNQRVVIPDVDRVVPVVVPEVVPVVPFPVVEAVVLFTVVEPDWF